MENQKIPPSLLELQTWMKWIVTDPRGVHAALAEPFVVASENGERYTAPEKSAYPWIDESPPIDRTTRLDIYAEAYFSRILESMKADFQITARILGDLSFQKLVSDYLKIYFSRSTNIGEIGRHFSHYVSTYSDLKNVSFLESLVMMEWLFIESFFAADTRFLESTRLNTLSDTDWETAQFLIAPHVHLIEAQWPLDLFWQLSDDSVELESIDFEPLPEKGGFLICREIGTVSIQRLSAAEFKALHCLQSGSDLMATLGVVQNEFSEIDVGAQVMNWFNSWVRRGIIYDIIIKKVSL